MINNTLFNIYIYIYIHVYIYIYTHVYIYIYIHKLVTFKTFNHIV